MFIARTNSCTDEGYSIPFNSLINFLTKTGEISGSYSARKSPAAKEGVMPSDLGVHK